MLRSIRELVGYTLLASDGEIGACADFLFDDRDRVIRDMVADTRRWLPGGKVLISPEWVETVEWVKRRVSIAMTVDQIRNSPKYDPAIPSIANTRHVCMISTADRDGVVEPSMSLPTDGSAAHTPNSSPCRKIPQTSPASRRP